MTRGLTGTCLLPRCILLRQEAPCQLSRNPTCCLQQGALTGPCVTICEHCWATAELFGSQRLAKDVREAWRPESFCQLTGMEMFGAAAYLGSAIASYCLAQGARATSQVAGNVVLFAGAHCYSPSLCQTWLLRSRTPTIRISSAVQIRGRFDFLLGLDQLHQHYWRSTITACQHCLCCAAPTPLCSADAALRDSAAESPAAFMEALATATESQQLILGGQRSATDADDAAKAAAQQLRHAARMVSAMADQQSSLEPGGADGKVDASSQTAGLLQEAVYSLTAQHFMGAAALPVSTHAAIDARPPQQRLTHSGQAPSRPAAPLPWPLPEAVAGSPGSSSSSTSSEAGPWGDAGPQQRSLGPGKAGPDTVQRAAFLQRSAGQYGYGGKLAALRREYPQLEGQTYVDHAGAAVYSRRQLAAVFKV